MCINWWKLCMLARVLVNIIGIVLRNFWSGCSYRPHLLMSFDVRVDVLNVEICIQNCPQARFRFRRIVSVNKAKIALYKWSFLFISRFPGSVVLICFYDHRPSSNLLSCVVKGCRTPICVRWFQECCATATHRCETPITNFRINVPKVSKVNSSRINTRASADCAHGR